MPEYTHTLIPKGVDFVPEPKQVSSFLSSLVSMRAAPLKPEITVSRPSGETRTFQNPFTGKAESFVMHQPEKLNDLGALAFSLKGLSDYNAAVAGKGPPKLKAFKFDFKGNYDFAVYCCLRPEVVSTSDWHDEVPIERRVEFFGQRCSAKDRLGIYHNPNTLEVIEVAGAGCARFWIEFEYGKMLFPAIEDRLDLIEPKIVEIAEKDFGIEFVQGCHWRA